VGDRKLSNRSMGTAPQRVIDSSAVKKLSHGDRVELNVNSGNLLAEPEEIFESWRRCVVDYSVDARNYSAPRIVTHNELKIFREPVEEIVVRAQDEIDRLYAVVRQHGWVVLLCNRDGVAIHHRGDEANASEFKHWGIWVGGVWAEGAEGTNGIGTCIAQQRPVQVHADQHFRSRHTRLSCAGAPVFDPSGELVAVLDVSRVAGETELDPPSLILDTVTVTARAVEERLFRDRFSHAWTIAALPGQNGSALLLAVDGHQWILGADRVARDTLALDDERITAGVPLSQAFKFDRSVFSQAGDRDIAARLTGADGSTWSALFTPPLSKARMARSWAEAFAHGRPRISTLGHLPPEPLAPSRGGLPPLLTQRVCEYIESHLDQKIGLESLAAIAGISTYHFARAFHQSVGMPPHGYLLSRRLERAERMLCETRLPLSEIAAATGFADQSHLARHFRRRTGMSPRFARLRGR
jgi:transcriptional regulator of acetoin/glycerol metabolism/AraC-like DNA-binding protein